MRFLADESCDFRVVRILRAAGYDVQSIVETSPRLEDDAVSDRALRERRILITEDKDFGQMVFAGGRQVLGVIFLRYPSNARERIGQDIVHFIKRRGQHLIGRFVVVQPGRIRITQIPGKI